MFILPTDQAFIPSFPKKSPLKSNCSTKNLMFSQHSNFIRSNFDLIVDCEPHVTTIQWSLFHIVFK